MDGFADFLTEMHWEDIYPKGFQTFRKEWGKTGRSYNNYYVQFSNHKSDPLERTGYRTPDHHDMVGDYAYPLKYVINHPADIWYGRTASWLRVLRDKSKNTLHINHLTSPQAEWILHQMGIRDFDFAMKQLPKDKRRLSTAIGKAFLLAIQTDFTGTKDKDGEYPQRSPEMQARLFLKAGIDAIRDSGKHQSSAVINDREPDQIVFLHRSAFEVVKVYRLNDNTRHSLIWISPEETHKRKLVSSLLQGMDDKIVSGPEDGYFWTKKGRRIHVEFNSVKSTHDRKLGEKKHKEFRLHDHFAVEIDIDHSEKGKITGRYKSDEKFSDIVRDMLKKWHEAKEIGYVPDNRQDYKKRKEEQQRAFYTQQNKERQEREAQYEKELIPILQELASRLGIMFRPMPGRDYLYGNILQSIIRRIPKVRTDLNAFWLEQANLYKKMKEVEEPDAGAFELGYIPGNVSNSFYPDLAQLRDLVTAVHEIEPLRGMASFSIVLRDLKGRDQ